MLNKSSLVLKDFEMLNLFNELARYILSEKSMDLLERTGLQ